MLHLRNTECCFWLRKKKKEIVQETKIKRGVRVIRAEYLQRWFVIFGASAALKDAKKKKSPRHVCDLKTDKKRWSTQNLAACRAVQQCLLQPVISC